MNYQLFDHSCYCGLQVPCHQKHSCNCWTKSLTFKSHLLTCCFTVLLPLELQPCLALHIIVAITGNEVKTDIELGTIGIQSINLDPHVAPLQ